MSLSCRLSAAWRPAHFAPANLRSQCKDSAEFFLISKIQALRQSPQLEKFQKNRLLGSKDLHHTAHSTRSSVLATRAMASEQNAATVSEKGSPRLMIVSDLDNTMVDHHDPPNERLQAFNHLWESEFSRDSLLVFSTGRSPELYEQLRKEKPLLTPGIAITSVGTEIVYGDTLQADKGWEEILDQGWDRNKVVELTKKYPTLKLQPDTEQRPHKISFHLEKSEAQKVVPELTAAFEKEKLAAKIIYSGGCDLDILSQAAGKGRALAYLLKKFKSEGRSPKNVLVCGDSGNDVELYEVEGVNGVIVGNAMEELVSWYDSQAEKGHVFRAKERCAAGIVEAIKHFKFDTSS